MWRFSHFIALLLFAGCVSNRAMDVPRVGESYADFEIRKAHLAEHIEKYNKDNLGYRYEDGCEGSSISLGQNKDSAACLGKRIRHEDFYLSVKCFSTGSLPAAILLKGKAFEWSYSNQTGSASSDENGKLKISVRTIQPAPQSNLRVRFADDTVNVTTSQGPYELIFSATNCLGK
jgi:hypothetical protein